MKKMLCVLALVAAACGSEESFTWGDVSLDISTKFCSALVQCGYTWTEAEVDICVEHAAWHMCEADTSCDRKVDEATATAALTACAEAISLMVNGDAQCYFLTAYGVLPGACDAVFSLKPEADAE